MTRHLSHQSGTADVSHCLRMRGESWLLRCSGAGAVFRGWSSEKTISGKAKCGVAMALWLMSHLHASLLQGMEPAERRIPFEEVSSLLKSREQLLLAA